LARAAALVTFLAFRRFGAGLKTGAARGAVGAGPRFQAGGLAAAQRRRAVAGSELGDVGVRERSFEPDHVDERRFAVDGATNLFDVGVSSSRTDRGEAVKGSFHFRFGRVEWEVRGEFGAEFEPELPSGGLNPNFLFLVDPSWRNVPAEGLDELTQRSELIDPPVELVGDEDMAGLGIGGDATGETRVIGFGASFAALR